MLLSQTSSQLRERPTNPLRPGTSPTSVGKPGLKLRTKLIKPPLQTSPMFSVSHVGRHSALHLSVGQAVPSLISCCSAKPQRFPKSWGAQAKLCMAGGGTPRAETTLSTPVPGSAAMGMLVHTRSPLGSEALIRSWDHSRACSTYLLTSCFLGAVPNKAANNQPGEFSHLQN